MRKSNNEQDTGTHVCICFLQETGWFQKEEEGPSLRGTDLFFLISYQKAFDARGDCRQQVLRIGMSEHLTSIHRVTADSRFFVCQQFRNKTEQVSHQRERG